MCLGHTHAISGALAGIVVAEYVLHSSPVNTFIITGLAAGSAVLPDLDHPQATLAHSFGFATKLFAKFIGKISGGHRHGTHSLTGIAVFILIALLSTLLRFNIAGQIVLAILLTLIFIGGILSLRMGKGIVAEITAVASALAMTVTGFGLSDVAIAVGAGCTAHIFGDMLTDSGCPLLWPYSKRRFKFWPEPFAFTTGTRPEFFINSLMTIPLMYFTYKGLT